MRRIMHYFVVNLILRIAVGSRFEKEYWGLLIRRRRLQLVCGVNCMNFPVELPGSDNFVHGSAGLAEGFAERLVHEDEVD